VDHGTDRSTMDLPPTVASNLTGITVGVWFWGVGLPMACRTGRGELGDSHSGLQWLPRRRGQVGDSEHTTAERGARWQGDSGRWGVHAHGWGRGVLFIGVEGQEGRQDGECQQWVLMNLSLSVMGGGASGTPFFRVNGEGRGRGGGIGRSSPEGGAGQWPSRWTEWWPEIEWRQRLHQSQGGGRYRDGPADGPNDFVGWAGMRINSRKKDKWWGGGVGWLGRKWAKKTCWTSLARGENKKNRMSWLGHHKGLGRIEWNENLGCRNKFGIDSRIWLQNRDLNIFKPNLNWIQNRIKLNNLFGNFFKSGNWNFVQIFKFKPRL
jgi:hypothetical protein